LDISRTCERWTLDSHILWSFVTFVIFKLPRNNYIKIAAKIHNPPEPKNPRHALSVHTLGVDPIFIMNRKLPGGSSEFPIHWIGNSPVGSSEKTRRHIPRKWKQKRGSSPDIESKPLKPDWKHFLLPVKSRVTLNWHWLQKVISDQQQSKQWFWNAEKSSTNQRLTWKQKGVCSSELPISLNRKFPGGWLWVSYSMTR